MGGDDHDPPPEALGRTKLIFAAVWSGADLNVGVRFFFFL